MFGALMQPVRASDLADLATIVATHNLELDARMDRRFTIRDGVVVEMG